MDNGLKIVLWLVVAIVLAWVTLQVVGAVFSFVTWVISMLVTLVVVGVILFVAYLIISKMMGGDSTSNSRERDRIYE